MMFYQQFLKSKNLIFLILLFSNYCFILGQNNEICKVDRQYYTKFCTQYDTMQFISKSMLLDSVNCLYSMSTTDTNGNELDVNISSFHFQLLRGNSILSSEKFDTMTLNTIPKLIKKINDKYKLMDSDVLYFSNIVIKHYSYNLGKHCFHKGLPMVKIIDSNKKYPSRMYKNMSKKH